MRLRIINGLIPEHVITTCDDIPNTVPASSILNLTDKIHNEASRCC